MTRKDYIAGLEEIRKSVQKIGQAFAAVDLTDATNMESDRHKKTKKLVADLCDRLYEDIAISAKVAADNAEAGIGEQGDLFDDAAKTAKAKAAKPAEEAEVVDVPAVESGKPLALPAPAAKDVPPCKHHDGEGCTNKKAPCSNGLCDGKDDGCPCYKAGKAAKKKSGKGGKKSGGKKGGAK